MTSCGRIDVSNGKACEEIEELTSDAIDHDMVSYLMTGSHDVLWRAIPHFLSQPGDCTMKVDDVPFDEKADHMKESMRFNQTRCRQTGVQFEKLPSDPWKMERNAL